MLKGKAVYSEGRSEKQSSTTFNGVINHANETLPYTS